MFRSGDKLDSGCKKQLNVSVSFCQFESRKSRVRMCSISTCIRLFYSAALLSQQISVLHMQNADYTNLVTRAVSKDKNKSVFSRTNEVKVSTLITQTRFLVKKGRKQ